MKSLNHELMRNKISSWPSISHKADIVNIKVLLLHSVQAVYSFLLPLKLQLEPKVEPAFFNLNAGQTLYNKNI